MPERDTPDAPDARGAEAGDAAAPVRARRGRRRLLAATGALAVAGGGAAWLGLANGGLADGGRAAPPAGPHTVRVAVQAGGVRRPAARGLLGSNVQWVDRGDDLLDAAGRFDEARLARVRELGLAGLRYPGGLQSDTYRWQAGMGPIEARGSNEHAHSRRRQPTLMGTLEFLELCELAGAEPLLTANLVTGSAEEAAGWVRAVNVDGLRSRRSGRPLPPVRHWELGNEPYLKPDERPDLWLAPAEFARRAGAAAEAMRAVDPGLRLGLPLTPARRRGITSSPYLDFVPTVYGALAGRVDWIAVHLGYMPFFWTRSPSREDLYLGAMAGAATVRADLEAFRAELAALRPGLPVPPFWLTEFHAIFTLGQGASDALIASPAGALYVADLLRMLAQDGGVVRAHQWSLTGNWYFGTLHQDGHPRPVHAALALVSQVLRGEVLPLAIEVGRVALPARGSAAAQPALPWLEALACLDGDRLQLLLIHKDPARRAELQLDLSALGDWEPDGPATVLDAEDPMDTRDAAGAWRRSEAAPGRGAGGPARFGLALPPASLARLGFRRRGSAA